MLSISAVLPAYNEQDNILQTSRSIAKVLSELGADYEVVVVDDGSADRTSEMVEQAHAEDERIRLVRHVVNKGYGSALATGFDAAIKDLIFMTDGDGQFDAREITRLIDHITDTDVVVGYRAPRRDPFIRKLNAFGWNMLGLILFGYTVRDVDCAFKLFRRKVWQSINVGSRGATFSLEFMVRAKRAGFVFMEVPVTHLPRTAGQQTGAKLSVIARAFRELFSFYRTLATEGHSRT